MQSASVKATQSQAGRVEVKGTCIYSPLDYCAGPVIAGVTGPRTVWPLLSGLPLAPSPAAMHFVGRPAEAAAGGQQRQALNGRAHCTRRATRLGTTRCSRLCKPMPWHALPARPSLLLGAPSTRLSLQHRLPLLAHDALPDGVPRKQALVGRVLKRHALGLCGRGRQGRMGGRREGVSSSMSQQGAAEARAHSMRNGRLHATRRSRALARQQEPGVNGHEQVPAGEEQKNSPLHGAAKQEMAGRVTARSAMRTAPHSASLHLETSSCPPSYGPHHSIDRKDWPMTKLSR